MSDAEILERAAEIMWAANYHREAAAIRYRALRAGLKPPDVRGASGVLEGNPMTAPYLTDVECAELKAHGASHGWLCQCDRIARNALPRLLAEREALRSALERHWKVIEDAMPYIPGSSFVAGKIDALETERRALLSGGGAREEAERG
jgi:hypothetical protein